MTTPLRLVVYDRTCAKYGVGLSTAWWAGAALSRGLSRADATYGASTWAEALEWLGKVEPERPIAEVQYWGHGKWGRLLIGNESFDARSFDIHREALKSVRTRLAPDALVWLRTCETFGADAGLAFAEQLADATGARVAGHTFIIGAIQSGLRALEPRKRPAWSPYEALEQGTPAEPLRARTSSLLAVRTVHCLENAFPRAWFTEDGR